MYICLVKPTSTQNFLSYVVWLKKTGNQYHKEVVNRHPFKN